MLEKPCVARESVMAYKKAVEVIAITRATESETGERMYQIVFGEVLPIDEELRKFLPALPMSKPPKDMYPTSLIVFAKFLREVPYIVGSQWFLKIEDNGIISLEKMKQK
jgi:hypothetical protein